MLFASSVFRFFLRPPPKRYSSFLLNTMWSPLFCLLVFAGLAACCVSLPQIQYVNDKPYYLMQNMECRGGKIYEINQVQDIDECKAACVTRNCRAVNLFQLGEFQFKCEILAHVHGYFPAQGAACYISYV
ncbi:hypothetical protein niasHS_003512 [Heterodera schachtii]|uniref:Apple domain-containing protein n=2 Tax=Heterodera TaxID=34509 RepID=A0ABD2KGW9_HETSC